MHPSASKVLKATKQDSEHITTKNLCTFMIFGRISRVTQNSKSDKRTIIALASTLPVTQKLK